MTQIVKFDRAHFDGNFLKKNNLKMFQLGFEQHQLLRAKLKRLFFYH